MRILTQIRWGWARGNYIKYRLNLPCLINSFEPQNCYLVGVFVSYLNLNWLEGCLCLVGKIKLLDTHNIKIQFSSSLLAFKKFFLPITMWKWTVSNSWSRMAKSARPNKTYWDTALICSFSYYHQWPWIQSRHFLYWVLKKKHKFYTIHFILLLDHQFTFLKALKDGRLARTGLRAFPVQLEFLRWMIANIKNSSATLVCQ